MALVLSARIGEHPLALIEVRRLEALDKEEPGKPMEYEVIVHRQNAPLSAGRVWHRRSDGWEALASTALALLADEAEELRSKPKEE